MTSNYIKTFIRIYLVIFLVNVMWLGYEWLFLFQVKPVLLFFKPDVFVSVLLSGGFAAYLSNHPQLFLLPDLLFIVLNLLPPLFILNKSRFSFIPAYTTPFYNLFYASLYNTYGIISIETFAPLILLPVLFAAKKQTDFIWRAEILRYGVIVLIVSAGIWKLREQGFLHKNNMSAILQFQHATYLAMFPKSLKATIINYLIFHPSVSYLFYIGATILELLFAFGFLTRKLDRYLLLLLIVFVTSNYLIMHINYFFWLLFGPLFSLPRNKSELSIKGLHSLPG